MMNLNYVLRAQSVRRWHTVETSRPQSVAEHSFCVAFIARRIALFMNIDDGPVIKLALSHDLDEITYGDLPEPAKAALFSDFEIDIDCMTWGGRTYTSLVQEIVAVSDIIEAWLFLTEFGVGTHAQDTAAEIGFRMDEALGLHTSDKNSGHITGVQKAAQKLVAELNPKRSRP